MKSLQNIPAFLLLAYLTRLLITGASIGDSLVIIGLAALYSGWTYLESKKETPVNKAILDRIVDLEEQIKVTKDNVSAMKISGTYRK